MTHPSERDCGQSSKAIEESISSRSLNNHQDTNSHHHRPYLPHRPSLHHGLEHVRHGAQRVHYFSAETLKLDFITIHYLWFMLIIMVSSVIFWAAGHNAHQPESTEPDAPIAERISYVNALFMTTSATTQTGLNTVNLASLTSFQVALLWLLFVGGNDVLISWGILLRRKYAFKQAFKENIEAYEDAKKARAEEGKYKGEEGGKGKSLGELLEGKFRGDVKGKGKELLGPTEDGKGGVTMGDGGDVKTTDWALPSDEKKTATVADALGSHPVAESSQNGANSKIDSTAPQAQAVQEEPKLEHSHHPHYLSKHTVGRNATFTHLSHAEKAHLGGVEYRANDLLIYVVPAYMVFWLLFGFLAIGGWMANYKAEYLHEHGIKPWSMGIFTSGSAFTGTGIMLFDDNMVPLREDVFPQIIVMLLVMIGNSCYPVALRFLLWLSLKVLNATTTEEKFAETKASLKFILAYPRRVYIYLFAKGPTLWLLGFTMGYNILNWIMYTLLNYQNPSITKAYDIYNPTVPGAPISGGTFAINGLFTGTGIATGFNVILLAQLPKSMQFYYAVMMWISIYPLVITMRHSNVYEERSLGIYAQVKSEAIAPQDRKHNAWFRRSKMKKLMTELSVEANNALSPGGTGAGHGPNGFVKQQIKAQFAHDVLVPIFACFVILWIENDVIVASKGDGDWSVFNFLLEVIAGYGVGVSEGILPKPYSFSGAWKAGNKVVLCIVMLWGRHRELPVALDRAVQLPQYHEEIETADQAARAHFNGTAAVTYWDEEDVREYHKDHEGLPDGDGAGMSGVLEKENAKKSEEDSKSKV